MSNNYVKKYDVGQIKLDLPYANYIHELPLLSFGDVQHTLNLSLIFNSERKKKEDNSFYIAEGFKFNLQKRIVFDQCATVPMGFVDTNGKYINLFHNVGGVYTFDDNSRRLLRKTGTEYEIEYPNFSKETFNGNGYITGVYSKYDKNNPFLTYIYSNDKLDSITYRGTKTINFSYNTLNELASITYSGKVIELTHSDNQIVIKHFSAVDYYINAPTIDSSDDNLVVYSTNRNEGFSNTYSHRTTCTKTNNSIVIIKKIGTKTIDTITYDFLSFNGNRVTLLDVTNKDGVKTRTHFKDDKMLYSYEVGLTNNGFVNNKYCGDIQVNNVFNNEKGIYTKYVQKFEDGNPMESINTTDKAGGSIELPSGSEYNGLYIVSGWIKLIEDNGLDTIAITVSNNVNSSSQNFLLPKSPIGEWTYFSVGMHYTDDQMCAYINKTESNVETKDFRVTFQQSVADGAICIDDFTLEDDILILEGTNDNPDVNLSPTADCQFYNGSTIIGGTVTMRDILQYKINQMYGTHKNIICYDDYTKAVTSAGALCIRYDGNIYPVSVASLAVGKRSHIDGKTHITKTNFYLDDNGQYQLITKSYINGVLYKENIYNENLDIVSSTEEDATTHYEYVPSACCLLSKKIIAPKGILKTATTRSDVMVTEYIYDDTLTKLTSVIDEFGNTTQHTTDDVWGVVTGVTLPDGTVITDTYDDDRSALLSREFADTTNPRTTNFSYSDGNLTGLIHADTVDSISFAYTYDKDKLVNVKKGTNTIEEHEHTDTTLDSYYPTKAGKVHSVLSDFDVYGRLIKTDNLVENVYDVNPEYDTNGDLIVHSANASAILATSKDLTNNQTSKYHYNAHRQLSKKEIENSAGAVISEETFGYDEIGRLTSDVCIYDKANSKSIRTNILYEKAAEHPLADNIVDRYSYYLDNATSPIAQTGYDFDYFNRISTRFCAINGKEFRKNISYEKSRPNMLLEMLNGRPLCITNYQYDNMGRISYVSAGGKISTYAYDIYGQLVREDNQALDKSFQYVYNGIGNLVSVETYAYTPAGTALSGTPTLTKAFTYGDAQNPDRLTSYNGKAITYNANGGVASYDGYNYTWSKGKLSSISKVLESSPRALILPSLLSSKTYSFDYNGLGQRVSSSYNYVNNGNGQVVFGELISYNKKFSYDHSGRLIHETNTKTYYGEGSESYDIVYLYDDAGVVGMAYIKNGTRSEYYFLKNLQGDVVEIYDTIGAKVAGYTYDAWGNCTITSDTTNYTVAQANPFRYRSYYYDSDTNLYYLKARYYSPELRRFISPDDTSYLEPKNVNGCNLYCYCNNDPVNFVDPSGHYLIFGLVTFSTLELAVVVALSFVFIGAIIVVVDTLTEHKSPDIDDSSPPSSPPIVFDPKPNKEQSSPSVNTEVGAAMLEGAPEFALQYIINTSSLSETNKHYGPFVGGAGGGSLWDPIVQALLNEAFTGSFE